VPVRSLLRLTLALAAIAIASAETSRPKEEYVRQSTPKVSSHSTHKLLSPLSATYLEAADLLRKGNFDASLSLVEPLAKGSAPSAETARLILGFYANRAEMAREAIQSLESVGPADPHLEDWRLYALADSARSLENFPTAERALSSLLSESPNSPLRAHALLMGVEIAKETGDLKAAQTWIQRARQDRLELEQAEQIERLAWEIGEDNQRADLQEVAARRLLAEHPEVARELNVLEIFGNDGTQKNLAEVLGPAALQIRARRWLENGEANKAVESLNLIGEQDRNLSWLLIHAESLTGGHQGVEAYRELRTLQTDDPVMEAEITWQRALAALEASKVRKGRRNLSQSDRQKMRQIGLQQLRRVAELDVDPESSERALRLLFAKVSDDDDFEEARAVLSRLQEVDPFNTTGRRYLWRLGWQAYVERDYPVAIGYWSELESMYPDTTNARSGRYWTGRSHEALGHTTRAREIFEEIVAADIKDFYSRHASARLSPGAVPASADTTSPTEPWPEDAILDRALWLSEVGLDEFALIELEALEGQSDKRAYWAAEAVVLARTGRRRDSIRSLARAFPALGRPNQAIVPDDALRLYYPLDFRDIIERYAAEKNLSPYLVFAMVRQESAFDIKAKSWAGARGLMQIMPATGRELAQRMGLRYSTERLSDPDFSVRLGTSYYSQVLDMFDGNHELALAGYNGGPYRIKKLWRQAGPNPELDKFLESLRMEETKTYVKRILLFENSYKRLYSQAG
jgi:soluble lytic murein transglycosylase-like protein